MKPIVICFISAVLLILSGCADTAATVIKEDTPAAHELTLEDFSDYLHPVELGENWDSFCFQIGNTVYRVPTILQVYLDAGWEPDFNVDTTLNPNSMTMTVGGRHLTHPDYPGLSITIELSNENRRNSLPMRYCNTARVSLDKKSLGDNQVQLPGSVIIGQDIDALIALWGEPAEKKDGVLQYYYEKTPASNHISDKVLVPENQYIKVFFDSANTVSGITLQDNYSVGWSSLFTEQLNGPNSQMLLEKYMAPEAFDRKMYRYELCGVLYELPTPVKALLAEGWEFEKKGDMDNNLGSNRGKEIYMKYEGDDGKKIHVEITNLSNGEITLAYGFVTKLIFDRMEYGDLIRMAGGITLGSTVEEVHEQFGEWNFGDGNSQRFYNAAGGEAKMQFTAGKMDSLRISNKIIDKSYYEQAPDNK